jgi:hypothetical protein
MNEKDLLGMKFGDCKSDNFGNKYTRTIGGWVFSNFAGRLCFIPEPSISKSETVDKKGKNAK